MPETSAVPTAPRESLRTLLRDLRRLTGFLRHDCPGVIERLWLWAVITALATAAMPYATMQLIDSVNAARGGPSVKLPLLWLGVEIVLAVAGVVAQRGQQENEQILRVRGTHELSSRVLAKACNVAYHWFENTAFVNRLAMARLNATVHASEFALQAFVMLRAALTFVGCLVLLCTTSLWSVPVLFLAVLPAYRVDTRLARSNYALERDNIHRTREGTYLEWLITAAQNAKEIRSLAIGRWLVGLYRSVHAPFNQGYERAARQHFRSSLLPIIGGVAMLYGPYVFIVLQTIRGELTLGVMLLFILAFKQGSAALSQLLGATARAQEQQMHVAEVLEMLDREDDDPEHELGAGDLLAEAPELCLDDVHFTYPGSNRPVLDGLSLTIRAGETLAIVGRNGIGKTTLVKLLLGLYPIDSGRITLGGIDVASRPASWRRKNIGVVFQDFAELEFSAAWNVGVGWLPEVEDADSVQQAIEMADAQELISTLPAGIETPLGTAFGGRELSGGQWQRIALARLFMRKSRVWILDEPTSAMDPDAEERCFRHFRQWTRGRTAIIVAHRFSTVRIADRVAVVDKGRVIELGSHDELMAADGHYAQMFRLQAAAYGEVQAA